MKKLLDILMPIKSSTGLDIDLYSFTGELIFSTSEEMPVYKFVYHDAKSFIDNVLQDKSADISYFLVNASMAGKNNNKLVGVITGSNDTSFNYAVMVGKLIETALSQDINRPEKKSMFAQYLNGELDKAQTNTLKNKFLGKNISYYVLSIIVKPTQKLEELTAFLETMSEGSDIISTTDDKTVVYFKQCDKSGDYSSANDFAYILYENIKEELRINIKINVGGTAYSFEDLFDGYNKSLSAYNFGIMFDPFANVYSYKEYLMIKMLSQIPKESLSQYFSTLLDAESAQILEDCELMETAEAFMKNSLNTAETSRNMYMHRNTLLYRLEKIESATGLNLRHFNDAFLFRLITVLDKLIKN